MAKGFAQHYGVNYDKALALLWHTTADSIFIYYSVYYYHSVTWLRHFSIVLPLLPTFLLSLLRTHCSLFLDSPLLLQAIVLVTHYFCDSIVVVTSIVLLRVYSQASWVACSLRLDFLYPMVTEPIELEDLLSICLLAACHLFTLYKAEFSDK